MLNFSNSNTIIPDSPHKVRGSAHHSVSEINKRVLSAKPVAQEVKFNNSRLSNGLQIKQIIIKKNIVRSCCKSLLNIDYKIVES